MKWTIDRDEKGNFLLAGTDIVISDEENNVVALVPHGLRENLNLITAAPDMLAILKRIAAGEELTGPGDVLSAINATIKKAEETMPTLICKVIYKGSCPPDTFPLDGETRKMRYTFAGYAVVFRANLGRAHCTYLRGVDHNRAMSYAQSEGEAVGAESVEVWEAHAIPCNRTMDWSEETLPTQATKG